MDNIITVNAEHVTEKDLEGLGHLIDSLPEGQLKDVLAYLHDCLLEGTSITLIPQGTTTATTGHLQVD